jgi:hypothetical protein
MSLAEVLVILSVIVVLLLLLLPAIQRVRESSNRVQCQNNLHQVGLALHNWHNDNGAFPLGGSATATGGYGFSWWATLLPYFEQGNQWSALDHNSHHIGWVGGPAYAGNAFNRDRLRGKLFKYMQCPSSPLPRFVLTNTTHMEAYIHSPSYTGIAGAEGHPTTRDKNPTGGATGRISWGGVLYWGGKLPSNLPSSLPVRISDILDGTSNTIVVGEQSDFCYDAAGSPSDCRSDCWHGFCMGPGNDGWERTFNMTTVLHRLNEKSSTAYGIGGNCGPNRPLQSAHQAGVFFLFGDGSARFLFNNIPVQLLYNLANRNDDNPVDLGGYSG